MKNRFFTLLALFLSIGIAAPACGGDDDDNPAEDDDDDDGTGGGGTGGGGTGGGGTGGGGTGGGGTGGGGTGGGNIPVPNEAVLTINGANVRDTKGVFPFGVAIGGDGTIFVSTLGNRNVNGGDEPSRIYRFAPGETSNPEVLFEAGIDAGVYGLTFLKGNLYACISQHVLSNNNVVSSIYEITSGQLDEEGLTKADVAQFDLQSTVVNVNGSFSIQAEQVAGRCGQIANDGTSIYAPDVLNSGFIFRVNPSNTEDEGDSGEDGIYNNQELQPIKTTAWFQDNNLVNNNVANFGTTAINVNGGVSGTLQLFLNGNGTQLFGISLSDGGLKPEVNQLTEFDTIDDVVGQPFGLGVDSNNNEAFIVSDLLNDELLLLTRNNAGNYDSARRFSAANDDDTFIEPGALVIVGDKAIVAATQIGQLAQGQHDEDAQVFIIQY